MGCVGPAGRCPGGGAAGCRRGRSQSKRRTPESRCQHGQRLVQPCRGGTAIAIGAANAAELYQQPRGAGGWPAARVDQGAGCAADAHQRAQRGKRGSPSPSPSRWGTAFSGNFAGAISERRSSVNKRAAHTGRDRAGGIARAVAGTPPGCIGGAEQVSRQPSARECRAQGSSAANQVDRQYRHVER